MKRLADLIAHWICRKGYREREGVIECRIGRRRIIIYEDKKLICFCDACFEKHAFDGDLSLLREMVYDYCLGGGGD